MDADKGNVQWEGPPNRDLVAARCYALIAAAGKHSVVAIIEHSMAQAKLPPADIELALRTSSATAKVEGCYVMLCPSTRPTNTMLQ